MNVGVTDCLPCGFSTVRTDVEACHLRVLGFYSALQQPELKRDSLAVTRPGV
jgi:hypothetical protein